MAKQGIPEKSMVDKKKTLVINRYIKFSKTKLSYVYVCIYICAKNNNNNNNSKNNTTTNDSTKLYIAIIQ